MMSPQETQLLQDFLSQLTQVQGISREPQADAMIAAAFARQPDAGYLLVQRTMLQDQALNAAQSQIAQLKAERESLRGGGSSGNGGGGGFLDPAGAWGNSAHESARAVGHSPGRNFQSQRFDAVPGVQGGPGAPRMQGMQGMSNGTNGDQQYRTQQASRPGFFGGGGGGGGFLGTMAATAAGVAGGAFLFQGIGSLLGNDGGGDKTADSGSTNNFFDSGNDKVAASSDASDAGAGNGNGANDANDAGDAGGNDFSGDDLGSSDDMSSI